MIRTLSYKLIDSTNSEARRYLVSGGTESIAFVADQQSEGRGQGVNSWESSSPDGLYYSLLLQGNRYPASPSLLDETLLAKNIQNVISVISSVKVVFKKPNDFFLDGRKIGGILIESESKPQANYSDFAIIGIGLNINQADFPTPLAETAISLFQKTGKSFDKYAFVGLLNTYLEGMFPLQG
ncbi:MAG: BirA family biotin operon repressor/biotin-[acetyl-CoA-carboxylase] ligase [Candidatus Marinamargulisbacteria bacterium]|jgi:BirA family biotin operon repressor/biotin-[acetyl-CoA-carboxylase] ligase